MRLYTRNHFFKRHHLLPISIGNARTVRAARIPFLWERYLRVAQMVA